MNSSAFLLLMALALHHALPVVTIELPWIYEKWKSIPDINRVLGLNLTEGDIMQGSVAAGNRSLWDLPVPYKLSVNLSVNDRGVILRAFEQFRLKSCVDFKPRSAEDFYISVERHDGCWSYIGRSSAGGQPLSIGQDCGRKGIVEHQFLHALGLYHEHTRYDRDHYVTVNLTNVQTGYESYFSKRSENVSTSPYDYYSVMHFDKNAFTNGKGPTIITKRPEFQDVIGQLMEMSEDDVTELNKLYKCNSSVSFLDHCSFDDESLCQMSVSPADCGWKRVKSVSGVSVTDHTHLGKENGTSFFMHFSTAGRNQGDAARIQSKTLTPTRHCKVQCLQFFYHHSGNQSDQLNIWIRDSAGSLRLMDQITETPGKYWKLHHVTLNANTSFQVVFEARAGAGDSSGGFSLDDINISETECPLTWQIRDIEKELSSSDEIWSPLYYFSEGYRFVALLEVLENQLAIGVSLVSGEYDNQLQWPCAWRQISVQILDQHPHAQKRMSFEQSVTTDPELKDDDGSYHWRKPQRGPFTISGETVFAGGVAYLTVLTTEDLARREFIKGGDLIVLFSMRDISALLQNDSLPCPKVTVKSFNVSTNTSAEQGPCPTVVPTSPPVSTTPRFPTTTTTTTTTTPSTTTPPSTLSSPSSTTPPSTPTTPAAEPTERECLDVFCSSSSSTASSLVILLLCSLLLIS